MLEIEQYYGIDEMEDLGIWQREYNIVPREMASVVLEKQGRRWLTAGLWSLMGPWADSLETMQIEPRRSTPRRRR
jgi:putative SOS response-associated peptidase YedK